MSPLDYSGLSLHQPTLVHDTGWGEQGGEAARQTGVVTCAVGGWSGGGPPGPIPNPAVKPVSADGTGGVVLWESRSLPTHTHLLVFPLSSLFPQPVFGV